MASAPSVSDIQSPGLAQVLALSFDLTRYAAAPFFGNAPR
ncbi:MAG: hypothetical protein JWQ11_606, partial [Rhizobacter sp.]|nr:hypothetical protein [Rhizobacter sp.]